MVTEWTAVLAGMELFSGRLTQADPAVVASAYGVNRYWVNNFDTLVRDASGSATAVLHTATLTGCGAPQQSSIMVLFEQLVVNNWPIVMEGCVAATTLWARVYFIFFYGFSVVAVLSVLVRAHGSRLRSPGAHSATCPGQLAFLLESFAVKREHNTKILSVRLMRKQQGDAAAEDLQKQELDEAWYVDLERQAGAIPSRDVCCLPGRICYGTQVKTSASGRCQSFHHTATSTT